MSSRKCPDCGKTWVTRHTCTVEGVDPELFEDKANAMLQRGCGIPEARDHLLLMMKQTKRRELHKQASIHRLLSIPDARKKPAPSDDDAVTPLQVFTAVMATIAVGITFYVAWIVTPC